MKNLNFYKIPKKSIQTIKDIFRIKFGSIFAPKNYTNKTINSFKNLTDGEIYSHTGINPKWTYRNSIIWTPKFYIQKDISSEFLFELKKFRKLTEWEDLHQVALTQLILTEATRDTTYDIAYNYKVNPTLNNPFHGLIDMLVYNNEENANFYPVIPIIFPHYVKEDGIYYERYNNAQLIGICHCLLQNYKINYSKNNQNEIKFIKALQTNGHEWCLFEIHDHYVKRTNLFKPKMINCPIGYTPKIYDDFNHIKAILGLIRYSMNIEDNMVLKSSIYQLSEKSENLLIKNKEAVSSLKIDSVDLIDNIGLNTNLLENYKKEQNDPKLIK